MLVHIAECFGGMIFFNVENSAKHYKRSQEISTKIREKKLTPNKISTLKDTTKTWRCWVCAILCEYKSSSKCGGVGVCDIIHSLSSYLWRVTGSHSLLYSFHCYLSLFSGFLDVWRFSLLDFLLFLSLLCSSPQQCALKESKNTCQTLRSLLHLFLLILKT